MKQRLDTQPDSRVIFYRERDRWTRPPCPGERFNGVEGELDMAARR